MANPVEGLLETLARQLQGLPEQTLASLAPILKEAERELRRDLGRWLATVPAGDARYTAQMYRNALLQIRHALASIDQMEPKISGALRSGSLFAGQVAMANLAEQVQSWSALFEHSVRHLPINQGAIIASGERALMKRHLTSAARYVGNIRSDIIRQLALGVVKGETVDQLKKRLILLGGPRGAVALRGILGNPGAVVEFISEGLFRRYGYWAERLARTEVINAYNFHAHNGLDAWAREDEGALKRWDAALDYRLCEFCRRLHGQVVRVDRAFAGGIMHPPLHPNCRCAVVAWHKEWTEADVYRTGEAKTIPRSAIFG